MPKRQLLDILFIIGLAFLAGCEEIENTRSPNLTETPSPEKERKRDKVFAYENRIAAEWKGERKEGGSVWRCEIPDSIAKVPTWVKNLGSGGGGSPYKCNGTNWIVLSFTDGTRIGFLFPLSVKKARRMSGQIKRYPSAPKSKLHDSIGEDRLMQRTWFDVETSDLSHPYWSSGFIAADSEPIVGWSRIEPGLTLWVAVLETNDTKHRLVWPYLPGLSEKRGETPTILRVITRVVPDETPPTQADIDFGSISSSDLYQDW